MVSINVSISVKCGACFLPVAKRTYGLLTKVRVQSPRRSLLTEVGGQSPKQSLHTKVGGLGLFKGEY
jgi:hypothetical protein